MGKFLDAIKSGNVSEVISFIEEGFDVNANLENGLRPLYVAAECGHDMMVKEFLARGANPNFINEDGDTPLLIASFNGHVKVVKELLENGADFNHQDMEGLTALHLAAQDGSLEVTERLLEGYSFINKQDRTGGTALHLAAAFNHKNIIERLLRVEGIDINIVNYDGFSPLHFAAESGLDDIVELLLNKDGSSIDYVNKIGFTALHLAVYFNKINVVKALLARSANLDIVENKGYKAIDLAVFKDHFTIVEIILNAESNLEIRKAEIERLLHIEIKKDRTNLIKFFLDKEKYSIKNSTVLAKAVELEKLEIIKFILERENTEARDNLLLDAVRGRKIEIVSLLLSMGCDVNKITANSKSLLHIAILNKDEKMVALLLDNGADTDLTCYAKLNKDLDAEYLVKALHLAVCMESKKIVKILLDKGVNVDQLVERQRSLDSDILFPCQFTALHIAARLGYVKIAKLLLDRGANINIVGGYDNDTRPLNLAVQYDQSEIVKLFLERRAEIEADYNYDIRSALSEAVIYNRVDIAKILIRRGALVNDPRQDRSLLHLAFMDGHIDIIKLLLKSGADINYYDYITGETSLITATSFLDEERSLQMVKICLDARVNINEREYGSDRFTALLTAVLRKHPRVVEYLLSRGANVDMVCAQGYSPLMMAFKNEASFYFKHSIGKILCDKGLEIVQILIKAGANLTYKNKDNLDAKEFALLEAHKNPKAKFEIDYLVRAACLLGVEQNWSSLRDAWCSTVARLVVNKSSRYYASNITRDISLVPETPASGQDSDSSHNYRDAKKRRKENEGNGPSKR